MRLRPDKSPIEEQQGLCYQQGIKLLVVREHSILELRRKLIKRGYDDAVIATTIDQLQEEGALNEARFCEAYNYARHQKGYGPSKNSQELMERGVERQLIQQVLGRSDIDWFSLAARVYEKRFGRTEADIDRTQRAKQQRFLLYRGFTHEQISTVVG